MPPPSLRPSPTATLAALAWALDRRRLLSRARDAEAGREAAVALVREQGDLGRIAEMVAAGGSTEEICAAVAASAATLHRARVGLVVQLGEGGHARIKGRHLTSPVPNYPDVGGHLPFDPRSAIGQVVETGRPARVGQGTRSVFVDRLGERVAAPILLASGLWGTLAVAASPGRHFAPDTEAGLERFASLVALAIGNAEARAQLIAQALSDPLTGLGNRRAFAERLDAEIAHAHRSDQPLSLVLFDVDRFKAINDSLGHDAGDRILVEVAERMREEIRADASLARLGGDEFALTLPRAGLPEAMVVTERVLAGIRRRPFDGDLAVTLSAGLDELSTGGTARTLRLGADDALYAAKRAGRNRLSAPNHAPTDRPGRG